MSIKEWQQQAKGMCVKSSFLLIVLASLNDVLLLLPYCTIRSTGSRPCSRFEFIRARMQVSNWNVAPRAGKPRFSTAQNAQAARRYRRSSLDATGLVLHPVHSLLRLLSLWATNEALLSVRAPMQTWIIRNFQL